MTGVVSEILVFTLLFVINPFLTACFSLFKIFKCEREELYYVYFFFISLFLGLLAYTQETEYGDISRLYKEISNGVTYPSDSIDEFLVLYIYPIFAFTNFTLAKTFNNVQIVSLFWGWAIYFLFFVGFYRILENYRGDVDSKKTGIAVCISVFCVIIFSQSTELLKQAISTSLFFYAYSCYLLGKKLKTVFIVLISLGIHFSILFFAPIFFAKWFGKKTLFFIYIFSFIFWPVDLMEFVAVATGGVSDLVIISEKAEFYNNLEGFYSSTAPTFQITYWLLAILTIIANIIGKSQDAILVKASLLFLIILNLSFGNDHNFTRLLSLSYPFFSLLLVVFLNSKNLVGRRCVYVLAFLTLVVNIKFTHDRLFTKNYNTSYMGNSMLRIIVSPVTEYLNENNMSRVYKLK